MNMSAVFWIATIIMAVIAFSFIATPLIKNNRRLGLVVVAVALPVFAAALYWLLGSPENANHASQATQSMQSTANSAPSAKDAIGSVASMIDGLAARLQEHPDDGKSWLLLARSYEHLNRRTDAVAAYEQAVSLGEYDADLVALSATSVTATSNTNQVFGNLRISERSMSVVQPTDTVFIFARAVDGPAMPVAVLQRSVSDLPLDFLLNDSQAMTPDFKLSDFKQVIVTARISRSGIATDALQDLEAKTGVLVLADNQYVDLIIE